MRTQSLLLLGALLAVGSQLPAVFGRKKGVKLGSCPEDQLRCLSPMNHLCHKDSDCSGKKRCCHSACGRDCRDPARG
ncbi:WFDC5 isoform 3 [Pan troglodytes]|uniref:WFDC5 isoform 3 n=1 Tax=Pan troglodytes TaxID=9598 RepID=A0A2J8MK84_PANTR|nr:WFDC5 isoform 3 [Pan troglodytes]